ncbi:MAG TPA: hypothetical protein ENN29_09695 [Candidatus Hydrogenedentes bacterium]|nr:hypothetical protein [Candidatus Hydrogenedentota bacterium]
MTNLCGFRCVLFIALALGAAAQAFAMTMEEALAELPAKDSAHGAELFERIASGDEALIVALCDSVRLWEEGANPKVPMALHGLATHVTHPEHGANRAKVARVIEGALNRTEGPELKRFFMNLLRVCGDASSLAAVAPYVCDTTLFEDAVYTVEAIGGDGALLLLENVACEDMPAAVRTAVDTALMRMRDTVMRDTDKTGLDAMILAAAAAPPAQGDSVRVAVLCREALGNNQLSDQARATALRALANTDASNILPDLIAAAGDASPLVWGQALQLAGTLPGEDASRAWVKQLPKLPAPVRPQVIFMLGHRDDNTARAAVREALAADALDLRLAAYETIGRHGGKRALTALGRAMGKAESATEVEAIKNAMLQFPEPDVSRIASKGAGRGGKLQRIAYLEIISGRCAKQQLRSVRQCLKDKEPQVRRAAFAALAAVGEQKDLETLFEHLLAEEDNAAMNAARGAIVDIADRYDARAATLKKIEGFFGDASLDIRTRLLKTLDAFGDANALDAVKQITEDALFGDLTDTRAAALETLGAWRDARACDILSDFFERLEDEETRMATLRQLLIAVPRTISDGAKQKARWARVEPLCRTDAEKQAVAEALEKIK